MTDPRVLVLEQTVAFDGLQGHPLSPAPPPDGDAPVRLALISETERISRARSGMS
jgi:hypothetical protein